MPDQPPYYSQVLDHLGLVAGMFDELDIGNVIDHATHQNPEMRDLTVGEAVKAMMLIRNHPAFLVAHLDVIRVLPGKREGAVCGAVVILALELASGIVNFADSEGEGVAVLEGPGLKAVLSDARGS